MTPDVKPRAEPPRMDRRWPILRGWSSSTSLFAEIQIVARALDCAGLVAEITLDGTQITVWAARRVKSGAKD